jgi:hypothetical protein
MNGVKLIFFKAYFSFDEAERESRLRLKRRQLLNHQPQRLGASKYLHFVDGASPL